MTMTGKRLLSPNWRRLYPNATTGTGIKSAGPLVLQVRDGLVDGEADPRTWDALRKLGWVEYEGPAVTDERGYIVPDSDPRLKR